MIGALSIVRFRNPVKNPFELVMFFALITLGITATASMKLLILLLIFLVTVILGIKLLNFMLDKVNLNLFMNSFDDGNQNFILSIESIKKLDKLLEEKNIIYFNYDNEHNTYLYKLNFENKSKLYKWKIT